MLSLCMGLSISDTISSSYSTFWNLYSNINFQQNQNCQLCLFFYVHLHSNQTHLTNISHFFQFCTFRRGGKSCDIVWKRDPYNVTMGECGDFAGRVEFRVSEAYRDMFVIKLKYITGSRVINYGLIREAIPLCFI